MKQINSKKIAFALAILGIATLSIGCGQANPAAMMPPSMAGTYGMGQCMVNLLPGANAAQINSIAFNAMGITMYSDTIVGGAVPIADNQSELFKPAMMNGGKLAGTITVSAGAPATTGQYVGQGVDGNIYMNITPTGQSGGNMYGMTVNGNGTVTISAAKLSSVADYNRMMQPLTPGISPMGPMPTMVPNQYCINGMALSLSLTSYGKIYGGRVYFITSIPQQYGGYAGYPSATNGAMTGALTGTSHGFYLQF